MIRVIVTGDRQWTNHHAIHEALDLVLQHTDQAVVITHGDAEGADKIAGWATRDLQAFNCVIEDAHPAQWHRKDSQGRKFFFKGAGPERNEEMIALQDPPPSLVLAFHSNILESKGTRDCVIRALRRQITVQLFAEVESSTIASVFITNPDGLRNVEPLLLEAVHQLTPLTW